MRTGIGLAQAGEFGFVLLNLILDKHLVNATLLQAILAGMFAVDAECALLIQNADRIVLRLSSTECVQQSLQMTRIATQTLKQSGHVIICGYGRFRTESWRGCSNTRACRMSRSTSTRIASARRRRRRANRWCSATRDDASRCLPPGSTAPRPWQSRMPTRRSAMRVLRNIHELEPTLPVIVRTVDDADLDKLLAAGGGPRVIPEIVEGSLMLASHTLVLMGGARCAGWCGASRRCATNAISLLRGYFHGADDVDDDDGHEQVRLQSVPVDEKAGRGGPHARGTGACSAWMWK